MKLKEPKIFTLEEARETLPLVKRIIADIVALQKSLAVLDKKIFPGTRKERQEDILYREKLLGDYQEFQRELGMIGCHLKNPRSGIVGYYWDRGDGFIVELCWKHGDEDILYWSEIGSDTLLPIQDILNKRINENEQKREIKG